MKYLDPSPANPYSPTQNYATLNHSNGRFCKTLLIIHSTLICLWNFMLETMKILTEMQ